MDEFGEDWRENHVGTGSSAHCLLGQHPNVRLMSSLVTGVNAVIRQSVGRITAGCAEPAVDLTYCFHFVSEEYSELV